MCVFVRIPSAPVGKVPRHPGQRPNTRGGRAGRGTQGEQPLCKLDG